MKISKDLNNALEAISKEVDTWPAWKRSIDLNDLKKGSEAPENRESSSESRSGKSKASLARAARA
jgi:hypothetical protein